MAATFANDSKSGKTLKSKPGGEKDQAAADALLEEGITLLRFAMAGQLRAMQLIADAAVLAAEQVQDKRLEILELGPEASAADVFLDFAMTFLLEAPLVGQLAASLTKRMLTSRMRSHAAALRGQITQRALGAQEISQLVVKGPNSALVVSAKRALAINKGTMASLGSSVRQLNSTVRTVSSLTTGLSEQITPLIKGYRQASSTAKRVDPNIYPSDTPGVAIVEVAQSLLASHKYALELESATLEFFVRTGAMEVSDLLRHLMLADELDSGAQEDGNFSKAFPSELAYAKEMYKRTFELIIWTLLLVDRPLNGQPRPTAPEQLFALKPYVQPSLIRYWLKRFVDPETGRPYAQTPGLISPATGREIDQSVGKLGRRMRDIWKRATSEGVALAVQGELRAKIIPE